MKKNLKIYLASPRGFCAGVKRAIEIVEKSLNKYGKPVYVRHEIVHNKQVVEDLKKKGAVFIEELSDIKDNTRPVIFSAHGVPKSVPEEAEQKKFQRKYLLFLKNKVKFKINLIKLSFLSQMYILMKYQKAGMKNLINLIH